MITQVVQGVVECGDGVTCEWHVDSKYGYVGLVFHDQLMASPHSTPSAAYDASFGLSGGPGAWTPEEIDRVVSSYAPEVLRHWQEYQQNKNMAAELAVLMVKPETGSNGS